MVRPNVDVRYYNWHVILPLEQVVIDHVLAKIR